VLTLYTALWYFVHDICIMANGFSQFIKYIKSKEAIFTKIIFDTGLLIFSISMGLGNYGRIQNKKESSSNLAIFFECFSCFFFVCYIILTLVLVYNPRGLFFLVDLVPLKYYHFPVPLLIIIFHAYIFFVCHLVCLTVGTATLVYGSYIMPILIRELRMGRSKYKLKDSLRKPENIRHIYRCLQVLHANVFEVLGLFLVASNASCMIATLFCNFVLIKYWNQLQILSKLQLLAWTVIFMSFWACVLELGRFLFS